MSEEIEEIRENEDTMNNIKLNKDDTKVEAFISLRGFIPIIVTLITGLFAFYSGATSRIYNLGFFNVFSISNSFVEPNTGFPNKNLLMQHIELLLSSVLLFWMFGNAYSIICKLKKTRGILKEDIALFSKLLFFKEIASYIWNGIKKPLWTTFFCTLLLHIISFHNSFKTAFFCALYNMLCDLLLSFILAYIFSERDKRLQDIVLANYREYKYYKLEKLSKKKKKKFFHNNRSAKKVDVDIEKIIDEFHFPDDKNKLYEWIEKAQTPIGVMLITTGISIFIVGSLFFGSYYVGKTDALYQHNYYITTDKNHVALPVSFFSYAIIEIDYIERKDDTLVVVRTDKPIEYRKNSTPVQPVHFENVCVVDQNGYLISDPLCKFMSYAYYQ